MDLGIIIFGIISTQSNYCELLLEQPDITSAQLCRGDAAIHTGIKGGFVLFGFVHHPSIPLALLTSLITWTALIGLLAGYCPDARRNAMVIS